MFFLIYFYLFLSKIANLHTPRRRQRVQPPPSRPSRPQPAHAMPLKNRVTEMLGVEYPIVQARLLPHPIRRAP